MCIKDKLTLILGRLHIVISDLKTNGSDDLALANLINFESNVLLMIKECKNETDLYDIYEDVEIALDGLEYFKS